MSFWCFVYDWFLFLECAAAYEFAQQRGGGDFVVGHGDEIAEELSKAVGFRVFGFCFRHLFEQWECLIADNGELEE